MYFQWKTIGCKWSCSHSSTWRSARPNRKPREQTCTRTWVQRRLPTRSAAPGPEAPGPIGSSTAGTATASDSSVSEQQQQQQHHQQQQQQPRRGNDNPATQGSPVPVPASVAGLFATLRTLKSPPMNITRKKNSLQKSDKSWKVFNRSLPVLNDVPQILYPIHAGFTLFI